MIEEEEAAGAVAARANLGWTLAYPRQDRTVKVRAKGGN